MQKRNDLLVLLLAVAGGVIALLAFALLVKYTSVSPILLFAILAFVYAGAILAWQGVARRANRNPELDAINPALGNIMLDMAQKMEQPVLICDEISERLIWHNHALKEAFGDAVDLRRSTVGSLFGKTSASLMNTGNENPTPVKVQNRFFVSRGYWIHSGNRTFCLCVLTDVTELEELRQHIADRDLVVGYVMIDNVDEMLQYEQERYRSVASRIDTLLRDWAVESNGILKEYERDRYLFLLPRESFKKWSEGHFEILDTIRDIRFGESNQPVTISVGFSDVEGTYAEKEKNAQQALDMALQRGGDQIVVKSDGETEIFGGRTKSVTKRTRVRSRVVATELVSLISKSSGVLVMGHRFADFDSFASCVGLARICKFCGVPVHIIINNTDPNIQECLKLIKAEPEYAHVFIDAAKGLDLVRTDTLLLIADVNNPILFGAPDVAASAEQIVMIDHHRKASEFDKDPIISYIEPSASATSELISEMLEQIMPDEGLLPVEANLLLAGMMLDTKQFTKNTGSRTFSAALYLRDHGADPSDVQVLFNTRLDELQREAKFHSNVVIYRGVTAIALSDAPGDETDRVAAAKAADRLLTVVGVEASFALMRIGEKIHISARSKGAINVQLILEQCGGGGHYDSAATQLKMESMSDALAMLKNAIDNYLGQSQDSEEKG